jgi:glyoxylase-like metal-dependent hydrolase (beta-lactamase superfamily II)
MQISKTCYAVTGLAAPAPWVVNAGFIVGQEKTLIVDSGTNLPAAQTIHGYARCVRPQNEMLVLNLEPHFDHIGGNCFFDRQGIPIYAHSGIQRSAEEFQATKVEYNQSIMDPDRKARNETEAFFLETDLANPTHAAAAGDRFDLGGMEVEILATAGHTPWNLSAYNPGDGVLFCADCIVTPYLPNLEGGTIDDWRCWLSSLDAIKALAPESIVPGHGNVIRDSAVMEEIKRMEKIIKIAIEQGKAPTGGTL